MIVSNVYCPNNEFMQKIELSSNILTSNVKAIKKVNRKTKPVVKVKVSFSHIQCHHKTETNIGKAQRRLRYSSVEYMVRYILSTEALISPNESWRCCMEVKCRCLKKADSGCGKAILREEDQIHYW